MEPRYVDGFDFRCESAPFSNFGSRREFMVETVLQYPSHGSQGVDEVLTLMVRART